MKTAHPDPAYRGLYLNEVTKFWEVDSRPVRGGTRYRIKLGVAPQRVAERLFEDFLIEPATFEERWRARRQLDESPPLSRVLELWEKHATEHRLSPSHRRNTRAQVQRVINLVGDKPIRSYTLLEADQVFADMGLSTICSNTVEAYIRWIGGVFSWAQRRGWAAENVFLQLERPAREERFAAVPRVVDKREVKHLFPGRPLEGLYFRALWITGVRPSEGRRLRGLDCIYDDEGSFYLRVAKTKNRRPRLVPLAGDWEVREVSRFVAMQASFELPSERDLRALLQRELERNQAKLFTPGSLRHSRITKWVDEGHPAALVAAWAGTAIENIEKHYYRNRHSQNRSAWPATEEAA